MATRRRRLRLVLLITSAAILATGVFLPWWLPAVVGWVGPAFGLEVESHETTSWKMVVYRGVSWKGGNVSVSVEEIRVPTLLVWPRGADSEPQPTAEARTILARDVVVVIEPVEPVPNAPQQEPAIGDIVKTVADIWPQLEKWLPPARVENTMIRSGATEVTVHSVDWDGSRLTAAATAPGLDKRIEATVEAPADGVQVVRAALPAWDLSAELKLRPEQTGLEIEGTVQWEENTGRLTVTMPERGVLPRHALFNTDRVHVDPALLQIKGYATIDATARMEWSAGEYSLLFSAAAEPLPEEETLPPLSVNLRGVGDLERVRVEAAEVRLPGVEAILSEPVEVELPRGVPASPAEFRFAAELEQLPWITARGKLAGSISVTAGEDRQPKAIFTAAGTDLGWEDVTIDAADVAGTWAWPKLAIERLRVFLPGDGFLSGRLGVDFEEQTIADGLLEAKLTGAALHALVPDAPALGEARAEGSVEGPWAAPEHRGTLDWTALGGLPGGDVNGRLEWAGSGIASVAAQGELISAAGVTVPLDVHLSREEGEGLRLAMQLNDLAWIDESGEWWRLASPASGYADFPQGGSGQLRAEVNGLALKGESLSASVDASVVWPSQGEVSVALRDFRGDRLAGWVSPELVKAKVENLNLAASWDNGPLRGEGSARATYQLNDDTAYSTEIDFRTDADGNLAADTRILDASGVVMSGKGMLPVEIVGVAEGLTFKILDEAPLALVLQSEPNPIFWQSVERLTGWKVVQPRLKAALSGSIKKPEGEVDFSTAQIIPPSQAEGVLARLPPLENLSVRLVADPERLNLEEATLVVDERTIRTAGSAAWDVLRDVMKKEPYRWADTSFELTTDAIPIRIAAEIFPTVLVPEGAVRVMISHEPKRGFDGSAWLSSAALRPIAPLGSVRDIEGEVELNGYEVELSRLDARIGGRPVSVTGKAQMRPGEDLLFDVRAQSDRVPLVRSTGLIMRAGLDIQVVQTAEEPTQITGSVDLGPSIFFSDFTALIPTGGATSPESRPPYFSVREKPFSNWVLDVEVKGDDFLQLEVPVLSGRASVDFKLEGTLEQPRAIGRAWLESGIVNFPFATMPLQSAEVTLPASDPYTPIISALGRVRTYGYDVQMEASGTASEPRLVFSADPSLSSQEAFLMLSTGLLPDSEHSFSTSERARRLALYLGKNIASGLGLSGPGGSGESRVTVRSGENFTQAGQETVHVQVDLDSRWSLVGELDKFDAYNGGIKFRILER